MANTPKNRPARKTTSSRRRQKQEDQALSRGVAINVNGKEYRLTLGDVSGIDAKAFREQVGVPFMHVMNSEDLWDVDWIAGVVWLARRLDGERFLKFEEVAGEIGYDTEIDMISEGDEDEEHKVIEGEIVGGDPEE